jgi:hypothetical protein
MPDPAQPNASEVETPGIRAGRVVRSADIAAALRNATAAPPAGAATPATGSPTPAPTPTPAPAVAAAKTPAPAPVDDDDESDGTPSDPETSKRLGALQRQEQQQRARIAQERASLEQRERAFETKQTRLAELERAAERAKIDPVSLLRSHGVDLTYAAQLAWAEVQADKDPKHREVATRLQREREQGSALEETKRRLDELETKLSEKEKASAFESTRNGYLDHAVKAVGDETPLAKALAAKNPARFRSEIWDLTQVLTERDGEVPDYADLVSAYEQLRRAELTELGIDYPGAAVAAAPPTKNDNPAAQNAESPPVTDPGTPSDPRSRWPRRAALRSLG